MTDLGFSGAAHRGLEQQSKEAYEVLLSNVSAVARGLRNGISVPDFCQLVQQAGVGKTREFFSKPGAEQTKDSIRQCIHEGQMEHPDNEGDSRFHQSPKMR